MRPARARPIVGRRRFPQTGGMCPLTHCVEGVAMDSERFDRVAKALSQAGTRRGVVRLLAVLPVAGVLADRLTEESSGAGRRQRRKARHRHQTGNHKEHRRGKRKGKDKGTKKCTPASLAQTCAAGCGERRNECNQPVSCPCPSGQSCLPNGTCARTCTVASDCAACTPAGSQCSRPSMEGQKLCTPSQLCSNLQTCDPANTTGCPQGFACIPTCPQGHVCGAVAVCPPT